MSTTALVRAALAGQTRTIQIGRSRHTAGFSNSTPLAIEEGDAPPRLIGLPYLKTTFRRANFTKTLYTPSTLHATVGIDWIERHAPISEEKK